MVEVSSVAWLRKSRWSCVPDLLGTTEELIDVGFLLSWPCAILVFLVPVGRYCHVLLPHRCGGPGVTKDKDLLGDLAVGN